jgi:hypothetical protein
MTILALVLIAVTFGALTGLSHYVAPRLAGQSELPNVARFIIGVVLGILAPFAVWIYVTDGEWLYFVAVLACTLGAGAFTAGAYLADWIGGKNGLLGSLRGEPGSCRTTETRNSRR